MKGLILTAMLIVFASALSGCSVVDFDDVDGAGNPILTTLDADGFSFTSGHFHAVGEPGRCGYGGCVDNGTVYIIEEAGLLGQPITMVSESGASFSLFGFDGAQPFRDDAAAAGAGVPNATSVVAEGTFSGGRTETELFPLNDMGFKTFSFVWPNLVSVTFSGTTGSGPGGIAIDNIVVMGAAADE